MLARLRTTAISITALFAAFIALTACGDSPQSPQATSTPVVGGSSLPEPTHTATTAADLPSEPTATTAVGGGEEGDLFEVISPTTYLAANGELQVAGIIKYKGSTQRARPEVTLTLLDASGKELASVTAWDVPILVQPQSTIPYHYRFATPPSGLDRLDVKITAAEAMELDLNFIYADFQTQQTKIEMPSAADSLKPVKVAGTVKNTGSKKARNVSATVILYYADGRIADVVVGGVATSSLAPGETSEFTAESLFATFNKEPVAKIEAVTFGQVDE